MTKEVKTHCLHGHEFTPENTYIKPNGCRQCRMCNKLAAKERNFRKKTGFYEEGKALAEKGQRRCSRCEEIKYFDEFAHDRGRLHGRAYRCLVCSRKESAERYSDNPEISKERTKFSRIKSKYGLSKEEYISKLDAQKNKCKICLNNMVTPHLDHNHNTNQVRDFLCYNCNLGIGYFKEDIEKLSNAIEYIKYHNGENKNG